MTGLDPVPTTAAEFRGYRYPPLTKVYGDQRYVDKLRIAQATFAGYEGLLHRSEPLHLTQFDLRPYVAYPLDAGSTEESRPYHAVKSVRIEHRFPNLNVRDLGLIDLPGSGEAGLDVDKQFLNQLKNEVDLLLMVKRPTAKDAFFTTEDDNTLDSADAARGGVGLNDFVIVIINPDLVSQHPEAFKNALSTIKERVKLRGIRVAVSDVSVATSAMDNVMHPALEHLATRLAEMDRAAVGLALDVVNGVSTDLRILADRLVEEVENWQAGLPDQEQLLVDRAEKLRDALGRGLRDLRDDYDRRVAAGDTDAELTQGIKTATEEARAWINGGFGRGSRQIWLDELHNAIAVRGPEVRQNEYNSARAEVARIFGRIDLSLEAAVRRLWEEIAEKLRVRLTDELVPNRPDALPQLELTARTRRAQFLSPAISELLQLKVNYGSIVLRVTRPILRNIRYDSPQFSGVPGGIVKDAAKAAAGVAADSVAAALGSPIPVSGFLTENDWWAQSSAPSQGAPHGSPVSGGWTANTLTDEIVRNVDACIADLEKALLAEARLMPRTLAAAVDLFFDTAMESDKSEYDYVRLCGPIRQEVWPGDFDGGAAQVAAGLSAIEAGARKLSAAVDGLQNLGLGLRLNTPPTPTAVFEDRIA